MWSLEKSIDSETFDGAPIYHVNKIYNDMILDPNRILNNEIYLRRTNYNNNDNWWTFRFRFSANFQGYFYKIEKVISRPKVSHVDPSIFYSSKILLDSET